MEDELIFLLHWLCYCIGARIGGGAGGGRGATNFFYIFRPEKRLNNSMILHIREYGSTLYVGLACDVSPTNTNFRLTFLLTRLQEALYEDLAV